MEIYLAFISYQQENQTNITQKFNLTKVPLKTQFLTLQDHTKKAKRSHLRRL